MRVHLPGLVHRDPCPDWEPCAYTGKIFRLAKMLAVHGHEVYVYGGSDTATAGIDVAVISAAERAGWFGDTDWNSSVFNEFDPAHASWATFNARTIDAIRERLEPGDIIGLTMGAAQAALAQAFPTHVIAEVGVGYEGVVAGTHRCYESHAWMHYMWGRTGVTDGRLYDCVIPNSYDPTDYEPSRYRDDYLLYLGRMTPRKGLAVVAELAKHHQVVTAGPGDERVPGAEHVGVVRGAEKTRLLARARALISYSLYVEPFGGVAAEAMLCGVPVIASPFGAYSETIKHGETGFVCHTLADVLRAAKDVDRLDERKIRDWALGRFTLGVAARRYDEWLTRLAGLYREGWYG